MDYELLTILAGRDSFMRFRKYIKETSVSKYTLKIIKSLEKWYDSHDDADEVDWGSFRTYFTVIDNPGMEKKDAEVFRRIFDRLQTEDPDPVSVDDLISTLIRRDYCTRITDKILDAQGEVDLSTLRELIDEGLDTLTQSEEADSDDLDDIINSYYAAGGYSWGLREFDKAVGPLRPGDFVVLGARPETGKTSFILDIINRMLQQDTTGRPVLFLNNEEDRRKIVLRNYNVVLGKSSVDIARDTTTAKSDYEGTVGERFKCIDATGLGYSGIEALVRKHKPRFVVFNVLDKVEGFYKAGNETERLRHLAKWARDLGKRYDCVVFAVAQADASGEGQQYLDQSQLYGSKTGIPGEADLLLMEGRSGDPSLDKFRYFNICKNKLPGDATTDPNLKHHRFPLEFNPTTGRYDDV